MVAIVCPSDRPHEELLTHLKTHHGRAPSRAPAPLPSPLCRSPSIGQLPGAMDRYQSIAEATMRNDPPTNLRREFGYSGARRVGATGFRSSRSAGQVNKDTRDNRTLRKLRAECEQDSGWLPFVVHWGEQGVSADEILASLHRAQHYIWLKSRGCPLHFRDRTAGAIPV
jgi:hypothetical protein